MWDKSVSFQRLAMTSRSLAVVALATALLVATPLAQTATMPLDQVRPGMTGIGRTVFAGTKLEDFKVEVLGVMRNVLAPKRNLILARLDGGPLAKTGVIAGMSGSPVYIDGKLVGAVSYSLGQFSTEAIAGITPIAEMLDATMMPPVARASHPVAISFPATPQQLMAIWSRDLGRARAFVDDPSQALVLSGVSNDLTRMSAMLRPIAVPMIASGFETSVLDPLSATLSAAGFLPMSNSQSATTAKSNRPLQPGDAVGVGLLTGDFELGATGTVTHVDGDRVYAFGHPLYNLGPTEFPMTRAYVYTVLPSLASSFKLSTTGEVIGTFLQDRATAIAGRVGPGPRTIPITLTLEAERGQKHTFRYDVVNDQMFTPLMTYAALLNTLSSYERQYGATTFSVR